MGGWRTWVGIGGVVASGGLYAFGITDTAATVAGMAGSIGMVAYGIGVKIEKVLRMVSEGAKFAADEMAKQNERNKPTEPPAA